ncbi:MAG TPA: hypothetical protein VNN10_13530 [Dehalococcoidia bacterium]|nr:hypothetical protein [Dehalococcoidia bacterium]
MGWTTKILDEVRARIAPADETLEAARTRRGEVLGALKDYPGRLRDYASGSIGHRTANDDTDADCGVVLDRRTYPELGPDGSEVGPEAVMNDVRKLVREKLKDAHPGMATRLSKRAIIVKFNEPLSNDDDAPDPSVDLIVALTRRGADGLWIPNRDADSWDASHPEKHTALLTDPPEDLRRLRARTIRIAKAQNKQYSTPALSSFNIEALALECITKAESLGEAVTRWFEYAATELKKANTKDPAGVSPPIRLLLDRDVVVQRLESAAKHMRAALDRDDDEDAAREELAVVFWKYIQKPAGKESKAALASALRSGNGAFNRAGIFAPGTASVLKTPASFGDDQVR